MANRSLDRLSARSAYRSSDRLSAYRWDESLGGSSNRLLDRSADWLSDRPADRLSDRPEPHWIDYQISDIR